jgi:hypothetical protein
MGLYGIIVKEAAIKEWGDGESFLVLQRLQILAIKEREGGNNGY